jgi:hypothetical protein
MCYIADMRSKVQKKGRPLNLRDFPDELYWLAKMCAANRRMTLKAYVVAALQAATDKDSKHFMRRKSEIPAE